MDALLEKMNQKDDDIAALRKEINAIKLASVTEQEKATFKLTDTIREWENKLDLEQRTMKNTHEAAIEKLKQEYATRIQTLEKNIELEKVKTAAAVEKRREVMSEDDANEVMPPPKKNVFGQVVQPGKKELRVTVSNLIQFKEDFKVEINTLKTEIEKLKGVIDERDAEIVKLKDKVVNAENDKENAEMRMQNMEKNK